MPTLIRYLVSLLAHLAWQRMGKGGPVPPLRFPGGRSVPLPVIGTWQMMAALWLAGKVWERYGTQVNNRVKQTGQKLADKAGSFLDPAGANPPPSSATPPAPPRPPANLSTQPLPGQLPAGKVLTSLQNGSPD